MSGRWATCSRRHVAEVFSRQRSARCGSAVNALCTGALVRRDAYGWPVCAAARQVFRREFSACRYVTARRGAFKSRHFGLASGTLADRSLKDGQLNLAPFISVFPLFAFLPLSR
ncbi:hypothetical protein PUN28_002940 [Cardiocondyla obscurior]|uniref:Uncharacterized protein n=1 Tax=Cardiocondyla obscurior TaxID=286306 RepID=A0AAW2GWP5_9HYME